MVEVHVECDLDFPAATVWALLEDFGDINWAPGIDKIEVIGEGIGMIRRLHLAGMEPIDEQLESMDASNMSFGYTIPRGIPMPVTDYSANAKVTAIDDGRCHVDWYGRATPQGASDEEAAAMIRGAYEMLLQWVDEHLKSRA
jgi:carbon monoxide dehydrogenase subunit G